MRPRDIEKIADSLVRAFGRPCSASAGCRGLSSHQGFTCGPDEEYNCSPDYSCGGAAGFSCYADRFDCPRFFCPSDFDCVGAY